MASNVQFTWSEVFLAYIHCHESGLDIRPYLTDNTERCCLETQRWHVTRRAEEREVTELEAVPVSWEALQTN